MTENSQEKKSCFKELLYKRIHILQWLPNYTKNDIISDFIAGITVGLTMIPQSLAYAGLAGVSPQYGLYTAFIGSFTYIFFGTIKEVSKIWKVFSQIDKKIQERNSKNYLCEVLGSLYDS